jgi:hypothetical protein
MLGSVDKAIMKILRITFAFAFALAISLYGQTDVSSMTVRGSLNAQSSTGFIVRFGTSAPASGNCDAAGERGNYYIQTGDPASVATRTLVCTQTGASSYAWMPVGWKVQTTAPTICEVGDIWFDSDATAGSNLNLCTLANTWTAVSGSGSITVEADGTPVGTESTVNIVSGLGIIPTLSNPTGQIDIGFDIDPAALPPSKVIMPFVGCAGTSAVLLWDTLATLAPTGTCSAGSTETTMMRGVLDFPDTDGDYSVQQAFTLPADWTGNIDVRGYWRAAATSGDVVWQIQTACRADAEVDDVAWNTASTTTETAKGTTNQLNQWSISAITTTGCAVGELLHVRMLRNRTHASDSITGVVSLAGNLEVTIRRSM